jgi:hypothetical protein
LGARSLAACSTEFDQRPDVTVTDCRGCYDVMANRLSRRLGKPD